MRRNWLTQVEREYVRTLLDEATEHVKVRDSVEAMPTLVNKLALEC